MCPPPLDDLFSRFSMSSILQGALRATKQAACSLAVKGSSLAAWDPRKKLVRGWLKSHCSSHLIVWRVVWLAFAGYRGRPVLGKSPHLGRLGHGF
jgi:hypothetical protein